MKNEIEKIERNCKRRRIEEGEIITNIRSVENRIVEGEIITNFEIEKVDWEKVLQEHHDRLEKETREKVQRLRKKEIMEKSFLLNRECRRFLEENEKNWEKEKREREN